MKILTIAFLSFSLTACASIPPLFDWAKPSPVTKTWHYPADQVARFEADKTRCGSFARATGGSNADDLFDYCLQQAGYRLEISE